MFFSQNLSQKNSTRYRESENLQEYYDPRDEEYYDQYLRLEQLLAKRQWKRADLETSRLMLEAMDKSESQRLDRKELQLFSVKICMLSTSCG